jgi:DNA polymerase III subunit beta
MKVVISKDEIISLISKIQSIVATKPAIPILSNVLLEAVDDQLIVSATDLTVSMRCYVEAKIIEDGSIAIPARRFFQLVKEITTPQIKITALASDMAEITAGSSTFKIHSLPKDEFPSLPDLSHATQVSIESSLLKDLFFKSAFSAAKDDSRYVLNGVYLKIENSQMIFIGTDGKRLAKTFSTINLDPSFQGTYIIPLKAVEEIVKSFDDSNHVQLSLMHDKISLERSNLTLITKLLSGQYPDVERVIPKNPKISVRLHREELITLLKQVALFTADTSSSVKFVFEEGQLQLIATSSEIGEGKVIMPADYSHERLEVAFNPYYFLDILRHSKDEIITFSIDDPFNPGKITDSSSAIFVIMPMRINETEPQVTDVSKETVHT